MRLRRGLGVSVFGVIGTLLAAPTLFIPQFSRPGLVARAANKLETKEPEQRVDPRFIAPPDVFKYRGPNPNVRRNRRPSGVATEQLQAPKKGAKVPSKGSKVYLRHIGWTVADGEMFDSSLLRGQGAEVYEMSEVLSSWRGALLEMREGEKTRIWVPASRPSELEWGKLSERGQYPWVFEIELVKVEDSIPWYVFAVLLSPILIGELYIKITGKTPGEALNEYLYGDILKDL